MLYLRMKSLPQLLMVGCNTSIFKKSTLSKEPCEILAVTIAQSWN